VTAQTSPPIEPAIAVSCAEAHRGR
jgi:hypothetical protein